MMKIKHNSGFTLIEVIISVALFSIVMLGVVLLVTSIFVDSNKQSRSLSNSDQARKLSFQLVKELRNSVYANTGAYPLAAADNTQLTFYSNVDGGSDVERIRYYVNGGRLYRGLLKPTGNPLTYVTANETSRVVQDDVMNSANPIFYYYNENYDGVTGSALTQPVSLAQVRFVRLNLEVRTRTGSATDYFTVTAGGTIRGLKTNLAD